MRECRDPQKHQQARVSCVTCGAPICSICNFGTGCYGECAFQPRKKKFQARVYEETDLSSFDSVGLPKRAIELYGLIEDYEEGEDEEFVALDFFAVKATWMDKLDAEKITPEYWSTAALDAEPSRIEIATSKSRLDEIVSKLGGEVYFGVGNWLRLWTETFEDEEERDEQPRLLGIPATVYFYTDKRVASVGLAGPSSFLHYVVRIGRVRPTLDGLRKLMRFKRRIAAPE